MHVLILAGGGGTRLWPLSRQDFPKQFLRFEGQQSLLQKTVSRFLNSSLTETLAISTNAQYEFLVRQQLEKIDPEKRACIIIEPGRKNTGPAIAFAIRYLEEAGRISKSSSLLVLPSDHLIEPETVFIRHLESVERLSQQNHWVIFGIRPTRAESGFGYIQIGPQFDLFTYQVKRFVEKPAPQLAKHYLASGDYYWNAGMFAFSMDHFWRELSLYAPEIERGMKGTLAEIAAQFDQLPNISFDYAILEKTRKALVCPLPVSWSDVGCWDSVYETLAKDQNQNVKIGHVLALDTKNSLIIGGKRLISTVGLEDMLIVETDDATFITKKGESQKVKQIVQELIKIGRKEGEFHSTQYLAWGTIQLLDEGAEYRIQKIQIRPGQSWEQTLSLESKWVLLRGIVTFRVDDEPQLAESFVILVTAKGQTVTIANPSQEPTELLWLTNGEYPRSLGEMTSISSGQEI
jgi:mannose-1-phosphate guanylyltransferase/mannose-6-phosphate isomerase